MSTLNITENYSDGATLTQAQLNTAMASIETWANGNVDTSNIAANGVDTTQLATGAVTAAKIATDAVTTVKILDLNVTTAKINDLAVTTGKLNDSAVTTAKINDGAVTQDKRVALGQQVSSSSGSFSTGSSSFTDVTNLSVSITTTGRPVWIGLIPTTSSSPVAAIIPQSNNTGTAVTGDVQLVRDATTISIHRVANTYPSSTGVHNVNVPVGTVWTLDVVAEGTYTYKAQARTVSSDSMQVIEAKLVAFEL